MSCLKFKGHSLRGGSFPAFLLSDQLLGILYCLKTSRDRDPHEHPPLNSGLRNEYEAFQSSFAHASSRLECTGIVTTFDTDSASETLTGSAFVPP